jgi:hypothetical protein
MLRRRLVLNLGYALLNIRYCLFQSHRLGRHFHASLSDVLTSHEVLKLEGKGGVSWLIGTQTGLFQYVGRESPSTAVKSWSLTRWTQDGRYFCCPVPASYISSAKVATGRGRRRSRAAVTTVNMVTVCNFCSLLPPQLQLTYRYLLSSMQIKLIKITFE